MVSSSSCRVLSSLSSSTCSSWIKTFLGWNLWNQVSCRGSDIKRKRKERKNVAWFLTPTCLFTKLSQMVKSNVLAAMSSTKATLYSKSWNLSKREKKVAIKQISGFQQSIEQIEDPDQAFLQVLGKTLNERELNVIQQVLTFIQKDISLLLVFLTCFLIHSLI